MSQVDATPSGLYSEIIKNVLLAQSTNSADFDLHYESFTSTRDYFAITR